MQVWGVVNWFLAIGEDVHVVVKIGARVRYGIICR